MRGVLLCVMLVAVAGCAETAVETGPEGPVASDADPASGPSGTNETAAGLSGRLVATLANITFTPGSPFNVTLDYVEDNGTNASTLPWTVTFSNATDNRSYNGTGLPATLAVNLTLVGNVTMAGTAGSGNDTVALAPVNLIGVPIAGPVDPCAAAQVQAPIRRSGTANGGALGAGFFSTVTFDLEPCQERMEVMHTYLPTGGDRDMYLYDPAGNEVAAAESGAIGSEGPIVVTDPGHLAKVGTWTLEIYAFAGGPTTYDVDITFG